MLLHVVEEQLVEWGKVRFQLLGHTTFHFVLLRQRHFMRDTIMPCAGRHRTKSQPQCQPIGNNQKSQNIIKKQTNKAVDDEPISRIM